MLKRFKANGLSLLIFLAASFAGASQARQEAAQLDKLPQASQLQLGQVVFALYQGDGLATLTAAALAKQKPLQAQQLAQIDLIESGASLAYGLTAKAEAGFQRILTEQTDDYRLRANAWYWLAKLSFSQGQFERAQQAYQQLNADLQRAEQPLLSEPQWLALNYQAAHIALQQGQQVWQDYADTLPKESIEFNYLRFNLGVSAFQQQEWQQAQDIFASTSQQLEELQQKDAHFAASTWLSWLSWADFAEATDSSDHGQDELTALADRTHLAHGQSLLRQHKLTSALTAFGQISHSSLARDQALLAYAWALAKDGNWPMAMAIWQSLDAQSDNLYALQAQHALAVGYAEQGGEVQALAHLQSFQQALVFAIDSLEQLQLQLSQPGYLAHLAQDSQFIDSQQPQELAASIQAWPELHRDLLLNLLDMGLEGNLNGSFEQLRELYSLLNTLEKKRRDVQHFQWLLQERELEHQARVSQLQDNYYQTNVSKSQASFEHLSEHIQSIQRQADSQDPGLIEQAHQSYANEQELAWLARLRNAQARLQRLVTERDIKPSYLERLERVQGLLSWQLADDFVARHWQHKQALEAVATTLSEAQQKQAKLISVSQAPSTNPELQARVTELNSRFDQAHTKTSELVSALESNMLGQANKLLAERREYYLEQQNITQLAMLQLQDKRISPSLNTAANGQGAAGAE